MTFSFAFIGELCAIWASLCCVIEVGDAGVDVSSAFGAIGELENVGVPFLLISSRNRLARDIKHTSNRAL